MVILLSLIDSVTKGNVTCDHYTSLKVISDDTQSRSVMLDTMGLSHHWLYGCLETGVVKNTRVCSEAQCLTG